MVILCYAKINLTLEILGKRADGYHEVRTVMQTVGLADRLEVTAAADLSFTCSDPALATPDNLVYRAARLLQAEYAVRTGAALRLEKRIPVAAGMGGGSSDAAATIVALNRLWNLQLSLTGTAAAGGGAGLRRALLSHRRHGACHRSGRAHYAAAAAAAALGRACTAAPRAKHGGCLPSCNPSGLHLRRHDRRHRRGGPARRALAADPLAQRPRTPARALATEITSAQTALLKAGAQHAHVSGSGPTVFAMCQEEGAARTLADRLQEQRHTAEIAPFVQSGWAWGEAGA